VTETTTARCLGKGMDVQKMTPSDIFFEDDESSGFEQELMPNYVVGPASAPAMPQAGYVNAPMSSPVMPSALTTLANRFGIAGPIRPASSKGTHGGHLGAQKLAPVPDVPSGQFSEGSSAGQTIDVPSTGTADANAARTMQKFGPPPGLPPVDLCRPGHRSAPPSGAGHVSPGSADLLPPPPGQPPPVQPPLVQPPPVHPPPVQLAAAQPLQLQSPPPAFPAFLAAGTSGAQEVTVPCGMVMNAQGSLPPGGIDESTRDISVQNAHEDILLKFLHKFGS